MGSITNFPYGVSSFGLPIVGAGPVLTTGKVFFVHSGTGVDANGRGEDPSTPFATTDYAVGKCRANKGDIIFVMPGHAESITAAGTVTVDIAGISIIGLGVGSTRPTYTFSTAVGATFLVSAAGVKIENVIFSYTGIDAITTGLSITGAYCVVRGCRFILGDGTYQCTVAVTPGTGADGLLIEDCIFQSPNGGPVAAIKGVVAVDQLTVKGCTFIGHFSTSAIYNVTIAWTNFLAFRNTMIVQSATGIGISVVATATGAAVENNTYVTANVAAGGTIAFAAGAIFNNQGMEFAHVGASSQIDPAAGGWA